MGPHIVLYIGNNHPNWLIFFGGVQTTNQIYIVLRQFCNHEVLNEWISEHLGILGYVPLISFFFFVGYLTIDCWVISQLMRVKFRSQTSDNIERWKSSQQGEESEEKRSEEKKMQVREKVGKSRNTVFFVFVAPEGWKVGSLKRRVWRHLGRWEMKSCTPFVARSRFRSEKVKNTSGSDHFWKLRCWKSARRCGAKHIWK